MAQAEDIIALIEKIDNPNVAVEQARCLRVRNRNASCSRCMDACPASCITAEANKISFDAGACLGCLTCCTVCPTMAMTPKRTSDTAQYAAAASSIAVTGGPAVFACSVLLDAARGLYDEQAVVRVQCISGVDATMMVYLCTTGATEVVLAKGQCEGCALAPCLSTAEAQVKDANTILETWKATPRVNITSKLPASTRKPRQAGYDAARRSFFSDIRSESKKVATDAGSVALDKALGHEEESLISKIKVNGSGTLPLIPNPRRARLLAALDALGEPEDEMIATDLWSQVVIDVDKCRACRICATFCPSGALFKFHTKSGKIGVKQMVRDCVNCHCCLDVCLSGALTLYPEVFARDIAEGSVERYEMEQQKAPNRFTFNG